MRVPAAISRESRWQEQVAFEALDTRNTLCRHMFTTVANYRGAGPLLHFETTLTSAVQHSLVCTGCARRAGCVFGYFAEIVSALCAFLAAGCHTETSREVSAKKGFLPLPDTDGRRPCCRTYTSEPSIAAWNDGQHRRWRPLRPSRQPITRFGVAEVNALQSARQQLRPADRPDLHLPIIFTPRRRQRCRQPRLCCLPARPPASAFRPARITQVHCLICGPSSLHAPMDITSCLKSAVCASALRLRQPIGCPCMLPQLCN